MGSRLSFPSNQSLEAVQKDGWALEYVKEQTPEICLAAVRQNVWALNWVKEQTPEICLVAVQQCGLALMSIKEQTPEICLAAIQQDIRLVCLASIRSAQLVFQSCQRHWILPC